MWRSNRIIQQYSIILSRVKRQKSKYNNFGKNRRQGSLLILLYGNGFLYSGYYNIIQLVITVDDTILKGIYRGTLFVAVLVDGNNQIYLFVFGVADSDNDISWE